MKDKLDIGAAFQPTSNSACQRGTPSGYLWRPLWKFLATRRQMSVGKEPAAWEGSLVGMYVEDQISLQHETMDRVLAGVAGVAGVRATTAGTAFLQGALKGAGIGEKGGKWGELGALVIGGFVGYGSYMLMQRDHPNKDNQTWRDKDGVPHYPRATAPGNDEHVASFSGPAGGNVMQMIA